MKKTGAELLVTALEQIGVQFTFGIPGVHNTEIYDQLAESKQITPVLTTHECSAAFMADAVSRTTGTIGTLVIVPAAGTTHAMSGIAEAFLDGIPLMVISGGTRIDTGKSYQLHQIEQEKLIGGVTKHFKIIKEHHDIIPSVYEAFRIAISGEPGPVFLEIPVELQLFNGSIDLIPEFEELYQEGDIDEESVKKAAKLLTEAENPGIYVGWGAVDAKDEVVKLAEFLISPVSTTLQGKSAFPANHPLHTGVGFGPSSVPAANKAFKDCDCLLAVGARFSELATGSYGMKIPDTLIHIDINPEVFNKNYTSEVKIQGDAKKVLGYLIEELKNNDKTDTRSFEKLSQSIKNDKNAYSKEWAMNLSKNKVSPFLFFKNLKEKFPQDTIMIADDGKHTFLASELFPVENPRSFLSPTDFNCMGYCVPAVIGAKLSNPDKKVIGIAGDGAMQMTGLELITASANDLGLIIFVFNDGELGQISQFQKIPLNRKTCTVLGGLNFEGLALATGCLYLRIENNEELESKIDKSLEYEKNNKPIIVDVNIDYSKKTKMTKGVVATNLKRFPTKEKARFLLRALKRRVFIE